MGRPRRAADQRLRRTIDHAQIPFHRRIDIDISGSLLPVFLIGTPVN
jgi:hypothetical protein